MIKYSSVFSQLLSLFPRVEFERLVKLTGTEYAAKGRRVPEPTPWSAFGLFWGLGEEDKARRTLARLNGKDIPFREVRTERAVRPVVRSGRGQARLCRAEDYSAMPLK